MRSFALLLSLLVASMGVALTTRADAQARPDGLYRASFREHASHDTLEVAYGTSTAHVRLGRRMRAPDAQSVFSIENENRSYTYSATYRRSRCPSELVLVVDGVAVAVSSTGEGNGECSYEFGLTRAQADRVAATHSLARQDRVSLGENVSARFTTTATAYGRGAPIEVRIELANPAGAEAVQREVGCCRFTFVIDRDGHRVQDLACGAMACPVGYADFAPGTTAIDSVDVRSWGNIDTPGHYRVECTYSTRFARAGIPTFDGRDFAARTWQREFHGVVEFDVR